MPQFLKTKSFLMAAILAVVLVSYAVVGFVFAPKLVRSALLKDIPEAIGATPSVGEIHINPFTLRVIVDDFSLAGADGGKLLGFKRLLIDFELSSLWHRAYTFANIDIAAPFVSAVVAKNGRLNLLELRPKSSPNPQPEKPGGPLPALRIGSFKVTQGSVAYEDLSRPDVFATRLDALNFELRDFTTGVDGGKFTFTAASKLGERFEWHGHLSVDPVESDGEFQVNGLLAHTLWEYLQDQVNFVIDSGSIDLAATYRFSLKDPATTHLDVDLSKATLTDFTLRPRQEASASQPEPWITLPSLSVTGGTVDTATHKATVDLVSLTGVKLVTWLEPDKSLNLMRLAGAPAVGSSAAGAAASGSPAAGSPAAGSSAAAGAPTAAAPTSPLPPAAPAPTAPLPAAAAPGVPWAFDVRQVEIRGASISTEDRSVNPSVKVLLAPFSLRVNGATQDLTKPVTVALDTRINEHGSLTVAGEVAPQPVVANVDVKWSDIDLTLIQPYISQTTAMTLLSGQLGGEGKLRYGVQPKMPVLQFGGDIAVDKLHTVDNDLRDDFINWDRLEIQGISYTQAPDRLDIEQIVARKPYARVIIESNESINVKRVLKIPASVQAPAGGTEATAAAADGTAPAKTAVDGTAPAKAVADGTAPATASVDVAAPAATPPKHQRSAARNAPAAPAPAAQGMPMSIKKILVHAGEANFSDLSVKPNFSTGIQKLEGSVVGLSSKPGTRAKVDLQGSIDAFSPVSITGEVNVLGPLYTDLTMSFRNISLPVFDPYSGKFAGYNIAKGKLTTELHYKIDGRKLDAEHHIVIEQLEFGAKTASKEAVSLPVKLAVSLLKDRNGVIDLTIPVTGSLDDPQFRLAPIIWKVFVGILEKAVTAPFSLLGSLFGGGPDLQFIDFRPGIATLDAGALEKVKTVAKALIERPQLQLEVPIAVVPDIDGPALVDARFQAQLDAVRTSKSGAKKAPVTTGTAPPSFDQIDPATQLELLTLVYAKNVGGEPKYPEEVTGVKAKPDLVAAKIGFLTKGIRQRIVVGDDELQALGQQRALALQQALLADSQVPAERVFLVANDKATAKDGAVLLELTLK